MPANQTAARLAQRLMLALSAVPPSDRPRGITVGSLEVASLVDIKGRAVIIVQGDGDAAVTVLGGVADYWNSLCAGSAELEVITPEEDDDLDVSEVMVRMNLDHVAAAHARGTTQRGQR